MDPRATMQPRTVRLMGGPAMNKRVTLHDNAIRDGRHYVSYVMPTRLKWSPHDVISPVADSGISRGYYKPTKNPEIWSFVGDWKPDPWKSYERRLKKWYKDYSKLAAIGTPHDVIMNMMRPMPQAPRS
jgi:hypothetical protein